MCSTHLYVNFFIALKLHIFYLFYVFSQNVQLKNKVHEAEKEIVAIGQAQVSI